MKIRRVNTSFELEEAKRVRAAAFLDPLTHLEDLDDGESFEMWGAFEGARMAGVIIERFPSLSYEGKPLDAGEIYILGVLPEFRGRGVAKALIEHALYDFQRTGLTMATLIPFSEAFYRAFGFEQVARNLIQEVPVSQLANIGSSLKVRQLRYDSDLVEMRELYERFALRHNLCNMRSADDWVARRVDEYGSRAFGHGERKHFTYLFSDQAGSLRAYVTFVCIQGPDEPFTGTMEVTDLAMEDADALRAVLSFVYGLRAKIRSVRFKLPSTIDLSLIVPESGEVRRTLDGYVMARALDVGALLRERVYPREGGSFTIAVRDSLVTVNDGTWRVVFGSEGVRVEHDPASHTADLETTPQTLVQLLVGHIGLDSALLRGDTHVSANADTLARVFTPRSTYAT